MEPFRFKHFSIKHSDSGHKVGTDGVLLGAWTCLTKKPESILDIGSGTGLIGLMMAQRSQAHQIDAIEYDASAFEESVYNFENSVWNDRLFCYHGDVKELASEPDMAYDLILCNPPFFKVDQVQEATKRTRARNQISLTYTELISCTKKLLTENGEFSTVIPYEDLEYFTAKAKTSNLYPYRITKAKGHRHSKYKRVLMQFCNQKKEAIINELILEKSRHEYTNEYKDLVKDFYLKM